MSFVGLAAFAVAIFLFSIVPGPGVFALIGSAMRYGFRSCIGLSVGMALSDCFYLIAVCYGLSSIAQRWDLVFTLVKLFGVFYLFYLCFKLWNQDSKLSEYTCNEMASPSFTQGFLQGLLISVSNPKVMLFYISFLPSFLDVTKLELGDVMILVLICFLSLNAGLLMISFFISFSRRWLDDEKYSNAINKVSATLIGSAGIWLLMQLRT